MTMDTIYALATPPGVGALAVVRVSGPNVRAVLQSLGLNKTPNVRTATLVKIYDQNRIMLDHALVTYFAGPASFTGEDVAELSLHGGRAVINGVMQMLSQQPGVRLAEPGEFTRRAFLNHKLDLTEAEAIADLIHAETTLQRTQALGQLGGALKHLYDTWRDTLIKSCAYLEAHLDFPDEDLPGDLVDHIRPNLIKLRDALASHLNDQGRGEILRDGINVVIIGAPNAGKSSLLNTLAQRDAAIVSEHAGTTRDIIDVHLDLNGYPVILTDTAGLRLDELGAASQDKIEAEGIRRAIERAQSAHIKLVLIDATRGADIDPAIKTQIDANTIVVWNKTDQIKDLGSLPAKIGVAETISISVATGTGMTALLATLTTRIQGMFGTFEGATLTRARHREALTVCYHGLDQVLNTSLPPELMAEELRSAISAIGRITGRVDVEDLLDVIFRDFCIGK